MALVVEDGSGLSNAESYVSVADTDSYFSIRDDPAAWSGATTAAKEAALRQGTRFLDVTYSFKGSKATRDQALQWPRAFADDGDGFPINSDVVPQKVKDAAAEAALVYISEDPLATIDKPGAIKRELKKVGPITTETEYVGGRSQTKDYQKIDAILNKLLKGGFKVVRT